MRSLRVFMQISRDTVDIVYKVKLHPVNSSVHSCFISYKHNISIWLVTLTN